VKSNPKQPSCKKKVCSPPKKAIATKDVKSEVVARNDCDGRLMEKNLTMIIEVNLVPNSCKTCRRQYKFT